MRIVNARFENHDKSKTLISFAEVAQVAKVRKLVTLIPENIALTKPADWTIAGKSLTKIDAGDFVTGRHRYTSDIKREGILYGKIVRPTSLNATLRSANTKGAEAIRGVKVVVDGNFIGVAAPDGQAAAKAASLIAADWQSTSQPSNAELFDLLRKPAPEGRGGGEGGGRGARPQGSIAEGLALADKKLAQTYTVGTGCARKAAGSGSGMEWRSYRLDSTQRPFGVRANCQRSTFPEKVRHVPDTGSGYGGIPARRGLAARLARAQTNQSSSCGREKNYQYFRPAGVIDKKLALSQTVRSLGVSQLQFGQLRHSN